MKEKEMPWHNLLLDDLPGEIWVDAFGFDGVYEVSNMGRIKSLARWVSNGKSERKVKECIRKQSLSKDGRLTCPFRIDNKKYSINIPELIYKSFYNDISIGKNECIMHKNKLTSDNRLSNLRLVSISESHKLNYKKGLLSHLNVNNEKKHKEHLAIKNKKCKVCGLIKNVSDFEHNRCICLSCRKKYRHDKYMENKNR